MVDLLEEHDDTIYDLNNALKKAREDHEALEAKRLADLDAAALEGENVAAEVKARRDEEQAAKDAATRAEVGGLTIHLAEAQALINDSDEWRTQMHDTLVNHKREALVQHKTQSANLQHQLEAVSLERDGLEHRKDKLLDELGEMEEAIKSLEEQIRQHSNKSAITDGRVNVAHARKKKRLDEEYEVLLEAVHTKRDQISDVDSKITACNDRRQEKEDAMKALERQLVEILVEQQKRLLSILTEAGRAAKIYGDAVKADKRAEEALHDHE